MSLVGTAEGQTLVGSIRKGNALVISAYGIAVKNGFQGTEKEWLKSLAPKKGIDYFTEAEKEELIQYVMSELNIAGSASTIGEVELLASKWTGNASPYSQVVSLAGVTQNSQVDLTPSVEQLAIFYDKSLAFVAENDSGVVTVYAIGQKPENDYTMQVTITEVKR